MNTLRTLAPKIIQIGQYLRELCSNEKYFEFASVMRFLGATQYIYIGLVGVLGD